MMSESFGTILLFLSGLWLAALAPLLVRIFRKYSGVLFSLLPLAIAFFLLKKIPQVANQHSVAWTLPWIPSMGLDLSFRLDGLSLLFSLLVSLIGVLVMIYGGAYFSEVKKLRRFFPLILIFFTAMLGLVLADNLLLLFIFWELTSISSYLLIGFKNEDEGARRAALGALLVTGAGGLALLAGVVLLSQMGGSLSLSELLRSPQNFSSHPFYLACVVLIFLGAMTKSAQFPFHFWLPEAMAAPTPVSAYLHSATMVNAGIYLLARLQPVLGGTRLWQNTLVIVGGITMLWGAFVSLGQRDLKRLLAYTTVSALGTLTFCLGLGSPLALQGMLLFLVVHCLYKCALFMATGNIEHATGSRDITQLRGLARTLPWTCGAAVLAALSMCGVPPWLGFVGKELLYESTRDSGNFPLLCLILTNIFLVAAAMLGVFVIFFRGKKSPSVEILEVSWGLWLPPLLLGCVGFLGGLFPQSWVNLSNRLALGTFQFSQTPQTLKLWHGVNLIFALSLLTLALGIGVAGLFSRYQKDATRFPEKNSSGIAVNIYQRLLQGLLDFSEWQARKIQHGYLRHYLATFFCFILFVLGLPMILRDFNLQIIPQIFWSDAVIGLLMIVGTWAALKSQGRLNALIALGSVGLGVTLIFALNGAPDLALTQVLVEVLTVLLFLLVVYRLPKFKSLSSRATKIRDAMLALSLGTVMTLLVFQAQQSSPTNSITDYFTRWSLLKAEGRNVVNVILVDFRGFDTLGEISVLAIAAIGVAALVKNKEPHA